MNKEEKEKHEHNDECKIKSSQNILKQSTDKHERQNKIQIWMSSKYLNSQIKDIIVKIEYFNDISKLPN